MKFALLKRENELTIEDWLKMSTTIYNGYSDWSIIPTSIVLLTPTSFGDQTYNPTEKPKKHIFFARVQRMDINTHS